MISNSLQAQESKSKKLIEDTHVVYESGYAVLQDAIKGLRRSLIGNQSVDEIIRLTKEIYQLLFDSNIPNNQHVCDQMKNQFNEMFQKIHRMKQWFEEQMEPTSSKGGSKIDPNQEQETR